MSLSSKERRAASNEAAKQFKKKIKLEKSLRKKMNKFLKRQNRAYLNNPEEYSAAQSIPELKEILEKHYDTTHKAFVPFAIKFLSKSLQRIRKGLKVDLNDDLLAAALNTRKVQDINQTVNFVTQTTTKIINESNEVKEAYDTLEAKRRSRANITAINETQKAAEGAKDLVAKEMAEELQTQTGNVVGTPEDIAVGIGMVLIQSIKTWIDQFDKRVRPWHKAARFQERPIDQPFDVMGEQLMYPGDTSLGASDKNVFGCRCVSIHSFGI